MRYSSGGETADGIVIRDAVGVYLGDVAEVYLGSREEGQ
jgi:hypothetical protein